MLHTSRLWRLPWLSERGQYRLLEIFPGFLVWLTFALALAISLWAPLWAIVFIILFDVYWLIRVMYIGTYLVMGYRRFRAAQQVDWRQRVETLDGWREVYHVIMVPTYQEPLAVLRSTFDSFRRME